MWLLHFLSVHICFFFPLGSLASCCSNCLSWTEQNVSSCNIYVPSHWTNWTDRIPCKLQSFDGILLSFLVSNSRCIFISQHKPIFGHFCSKQNSCENKIICLVGLDAFICSSEEVPKTNILDVVLRSRRDTVHNLQA